MNMELSGIINRQHMLFEAGVTRNLAYRKQALLQLRESVKRHEADLFAALSADLGKAQYEAYATEIGLVYSEISYMLRHLETMAKPRRVHTALANFPAKSTIYYEPYGVVLIMSPWNYPVQLSLVPLVGALAAGNCAVVKPSAYAPASAAVITQILQEIYSESYVYSVSGGREVNQNLLLEPFDYIFFTGGKAVGRTVMEAAAQHLTPITLELGGKSPCIVEQSADIALAARRIVWGKFLNCGQTCVAPDYVLVHSSVKGALLDAMVRNIEALYGKEPILSKDYGKIINHKHFMRLAALMEGQSPYYFGGVDEARCKIGPILLDDVSWDSPAMEEEIFGPILPVLSFEDLHEVKKAIERRPRPLALYLFTKSKRAQRYIVGNLPFGGGCINDTVMHLASAHMPFGGIGDSGMGAYHGAYSFRTFSHAKSMLVKSTRIDLPMRYAPYPQKLGLLKKLLR